jgi:hypothetical protein
VVLYELLAITLSVQSSAAHGFNRREADRQKNLNP